MILGIVLLAQAATGFAKATAEPKVYKLTPGPIAGFAHVKGTVYRATTGEQGTHFFLANLNTRQPVVVSVIGADPRDQFSLAVFKEGWKEPKREAATTDGQPAVAMFRTYDRANILVKSPAGARAFELRVVVGDEIRPRAKPAFLPIAEYRQKHPMASLSWRSPAVWGGILIALLAAAAAFFLVRRRRRS